MREAWVEGGRELGFGRMVEGGIVMVREAVDIAGNRRRRVERYMVKWL